MYSLFAIGIAGLDTTRVTMEKQNIFKSLNGLTMACPLNKTFGTLNIFGIIGPLVGMGICLEHSHLQAEKAPKCYCVFRCERQSVETTPRPKIFLLPESRVDL